MISTDLRKFADYLDAKSFREDEGAWTLVNIDGKMIFNGSFLTCEYEDGAYLATEKFILDDDLYLLSREIQIFRAEKEGLQKELKRLETAIATLKRDKKTLEKYFKNPSL